MRPSPSGTAARSATTPPMAMHHAARRRLPPPDYDATRQRQRARWRHRPRAEPMTPGPCNHSVAATTSHPLAPQGLLTPRRMRQNKTSGPHGSCHAGLTFCFGASGGALAGLGAQAGDWWWLPRYGCTAQASLAPPEGGAAIVPVAVGVWRHSLAAATSAVRHGAWPSVAWSQSGPPCLMVMGAWIAACVCTPGEPVSPVRRPVPRLQAQRPGGECSAGPRLLCADGRLTAGSWCRWQSSVPRRWV